MTCPDCTTAESVRSWARTLQRLDDEHRAAQRQAQQAAECER